MIKDFEKNEKKNISAGIWVRTYLSLKYEVVVKLSKLVAFWCHVIMTWSRDKQNTHHVIINGKSYVWIDHE